MTCKARSKAIATRGPPTDVAPGTPPPRSAPDGPRCGRGTLNTARLAGSVIGVALFGSLAATRLIADLHTALAIAIGLAAATSALLLARSRPRRPDHARPDVRFRPDHPLDLWGGAVRGVTRCYMAARRGRLGTMTTVRATTKNAAVVPADRIAIWPALTDPRQLPELTPLLRRTHTDGAAWTCMRISALGVGITPSFTERMSCTEGERIEYRHEPARGVSERTGAAGWYQLSDAAAGTGFRSASPCISGCRCPPAGAGDGRASRRAPATDTPNLDNWKPYARPGASVDEVVDLFGTNTPAHSQTWRDLEKYRRLFPRNLIVKGIMNPADAIRAADIGCDGVIVSNHGGRQLDQAPASLDVLPAIKAAVGDRMTMMLDSGVRRGADILIALCLGAQFVLLRPPDALRRGGRRARRGQEGGRHLPHRDRPRDGPDRLPEPRPARPRFPVAGRLAAQPVGPYSPTAARWVPPSPRKWREGA